MNDLPKLPASLKNKKLQKGDLPVEMGTQAKQSQCYGKIVMV